MSSYSIGRYIGKNGYNHAFFVIYKDGKAFWQGGLNAGNGIIYIENFPVAEMFNPSKYYALDRFPISDEDYNSIRDRLDKDQKYYKDNPTDYSASSNNCVGYERELLADILGDDLIKPIDDLFDDAYPNVPIWKRPISVLWADTYGAADYWVGHKMPKAFDAIGDMINAANQLLDPLVLDLDGNGYDLNSIENGTRFDMDADGFAEKTTWVKPTDGLLVLDKNSNGNIDDITELFGSPEMGAKDELRLLDDNGDNIIDINDSKFSDLKVWQDLNGNGISESGELKSLNEYGIKNFDVGSWYVDTTNIEMVEDAILRQSIIVNKDDGTVMRAGEFNFNINNQDTHTVPTNPNSQASIESMALPLSRGSGNMLDLSIAISNDTVLWQMVEELSNMALTNISQFDSKLEAMLYRWADVENIAKDSYIANTQVDAQKKALLERFTGRDIGSLDVRIPQRLDQAYSMLFNNIKNKILLQNTLDNYFTNVSYDLNTDTISLNQKSSDSFLKLYEDLKDTPDSLEFIVNSLDKNIVGNVKIGDAGNNEFRVYGDNIVFGLEGHDRLIGGSGNDVLYGGEGSDQIWGSSSTSNNTDETNELYGEAGNDTIYGSRGNDIINGGTGNDTISGNGGQDTVIFDTNFGTDTLNAQKDTTIKFNINLDDVEIVRGRLDSQNILRDSGNLYITEKSTGSILTIRSIFIESYNYEMTEQTSDKIGKNTKIEFADGTVLTCDDINNSYGDIQGTENGERIFGTNGSENIYGNGGNDTIYASERDTGGDHSNTAHILDGGEGNDYIKSFAGTNTLIGGEGDDRLEGGQGDDILIGGAGNDHMNGREGNNTYKFETNFGNDIMIAGYNTTATLEFENLNSTDFEFTRGKKSTYDNRYRDINHLYITEKSTGAELKVQDFFAYNSSADRYYFANKFTINFLDVTLTGQNILDQYATIKGTDVGDIIYGTNNEDTIEGGSGSDSIYAYDDRSNPNSDLNENNLYGQEGNDYLQGAKGNDLLDGGFGDDRLDGQAGDDILIGGAGNDNLKGGAGTNTYKFATSFGNDTIETAYDATQDILEFENLNSTDFEFERGLSTEAENLYITEKSTGSKITVKNFFYEMNDPMMGNANNAEKYLLKFADKNLTGLELKQDTYILKGTSEGDTIYGTNRGDTIEGDAGNDTIYAYNSRNGYNSDYGENKLYGQEGNDYIKAARGNDLLDGGEGNDTLDAGHGDDTLIGGAGDDTLKGGEGINTYKFATNFGSDRLEYGSNSTSILEFKNLNSTEFEFSRGKKSTYDNQLRDINNLYIKEVSTGSVIEVKNFFVTNSYENGEFINAKTFTLNFADKVLTGQNIIDNHATIKGTSESDIIYGSSYSDVIEGGTGNDSIYSYENRNSGYNSESSAISNTLDGGEGNDYIKSSHGSDTLIGGLGDDRLEGNQGDDILIGGAGNDNLKGGAGTNTYKFTTNFGNDVIETHYDATEVINFENLNVEDFEFSRSLNNQNDIIITEKSTGSKLEIKNFYYEMNDPMMGNVNNAEKYTFKFANGDISGLDMKENSQAIIGDDSNNSIYGTSGSDTIKGNGGDDSLYSYENGRYGYNNESETSNNKLDGGVGNDRLNGGKGVDTLIGGSGDDYLYGKESNDILIGGEGNDYLDGGKGNDIYKFTTNFGQDRILFKSYEFDKIIFEDLNSTDFDFTRGKRDDSSNKYTNINDLYITEKSTGSKLVVEGFFYQAPPKTAVDEVLVADTFMRFEFKDKTINKSDMYKDNIHVIQGSEEMDIIYGTSSHDYINGNGGDDQIYVYGEGRYAYNQENYKVANFVDGGAGNDHIYGGIGNDFIKGGEGDDYMSGREGKNIFSFASNFGNDTLEIQSGSTTTIEFTDLNLSDIEFRRGQISSNNELSNISKLEIVEKSTGSTININYFYGNTGITDNFTIKFEDESELTGADILTNYAVITGNDASNTIYGSETSDIIEGGAGNDTINAGQRNRNHYDLSDNTLYGQEGNDTIYGGKGNDTLVGGTGDDRLHGGTGNDVYIFEKGFGKDRLGDINGLNTIKFAEGISLSDLEFSRGVVSDNNNGGYYYMDKTSYLTISVKGTDDSIEIESFFTNYNGGIVGSNYKLEFADGTVYTGQNILDNNNAISGDDRNNKIYGSELDDVLEGNGGNDWLQGGLGSDIINGGEGNDNIYANDNRYYQNDTSDNKLYGNEGNDSIYGAYGNDTLNGGTGNDTLSGQSGNDIYEFSGDFGQDVIYDSQGQDTIKFIDGTTLADLEFSRGQVSDYVNSGYNNLDNTNDLFVKVKGTDNTIRLSSFFGQAVYGEPTVIGENFKFEFSDGTVYTGAQIAAIHANALSGDERNNKVYGSNTDDTINGNGGNDWLEGSLGSDTINGGDGNDNLYAYSNRNSQNDTSANTLNGEAGDDYLRGASGNDILNGGTGNDRLEGDIGNDTYEFYGNFGEDTITDNYGDSKIKLDVNLSDLEFSRGVVSDYAYRGYNELQSTNTLAIKVAGTDNVIKVNNFFSVDHYGSGDIKGKMYTVEFADGTTLSGEDIIANYGALTGDERNNKITGDSQDNVLKGNSGIDQLYGENGADTLYGGEGNDTLNAGDNRYDTAENKLYGEQGNDVLYGAGGADVLNGGEGNDTLNGNSGNDIYEFSGNFGQDTISDTQGISTIKLDVNLADLEFSRGVVSDYAYRGYNELQNTNTLAIKVAGTDNVIKVNNFFASDMYGTGEVYGKAYTVEFADGTTLSGEDILSNYASLEGDDRNNKITGDHLANIIKGNAGTDQLYGEAGADTLYGGAGNDSLFAGNSGTDTSENKLYGEAGNDTLYGDEGNDLLNGGEGRDTLMGYQGDDTYEFNGNFDWDTIYDNDGTNNIVIDSSFDKLWFSKDGDTLNINKLGTDEKVSIGSVSNASNVISTKDGFTLDNTNLDSLINAMAQFNPQDGITETFNPALDQQTTDLIAASWSKNI